MGIPSACLAPAVCTCRACDILLCHILHAEGGFWKGMPIVLTVAGVLTPAFQEGEAFTFTMCNPPFFESMEEAGQNPATAFSGTAAEMVCPGGELAFVTRMVTDSLQLKVTLHCISHFARHT